MAKAKEIQGVSEGSNVKPRLCMTDILCPRHSGAADARERNLRDQFERLVRSFADGQGCEISVASSPDDIGVVATLEHEIFANHEPASRVELERIAQNGRLLILRLSGRPIGQAQILFEPLSGLGPIERVLPVGSAFLEGVGIVERERGRGLQRLLIDASNVMARAQGKASMYTAVREGNGASLRQFFRKNFRLLSFQSRYFGTAPYHARLILDCDLEGQPARFVDTRIRDSLSVSSASELIGVSVTDGESPDLDARRKIRACLRDDYVGINLHRSPIPGSNTLVFRHMSSFNAGMQHDLRERKSRLARIGIC